MMHAEVIGVVVIGRNEGERLGRCLDSVRRHNVALMYVDSGSTDDSVQRAQDCGAAIEILKSNIGFTAARARNIGWHRLVSDNPLVQYVQFVDGDCEVNEFWLSQAVEFLAVNPRCAGVCGRRRERYPFASIYNALCDIEWDTPIGEALATGGDAMFRVSALKEVGGYRDSLIAGEEPEMCLRMRACGWVLHRLDHEMTLHDAAMSRFWQWWKRSVRTGHAFAEGNVLHGGHPYHHYDTESRRIIVWGFTLPLLIAVGVAIIGPIALMIFAIYPLQIFRLMRRFETDPLVPKSLAFWQATFSVIGKFSELVGMIQFYCKRLFGLRATLIEYK